MNEKGQGREEARNFMSGVLLLSLSTVIVKVVGLAFKIPMLSILGTEGMGYFNSAYEIYAMLCVLSTAGLPVALSMLISSARVRGRAREIRRIYRASKLIFALIGAIGSLAMLIFARPLATAIANDNAYDCIVAIAPALIPVCLAGAIRGYCQGFEYMTPTAISQLMEALGKLIFGVGLASFATARGYTSEKVAAFAVAGIGIGSVFSLLYLVVAKLTHRNKLTCRTLDAEQSVDGKSAVTELLRIALPITLSSAVISVSRIIDMALIMRRLQDTGVSMEDSNMIYGAYTTLAIPVFSLVPALITPLSMAIVPRLSAFRAKQDDVGEATVQNDSLRITVIFALPASLGLAAFAEPILSLLFPNQQAAIDISAPLLSILGGSVLFSCMITTTNAILQSYRRVCLPIISMSIGVIIKFIVTYVLVGVSGVGALGAPIGSLACNIFVTALNLFFMSRFANSRPKSSELLFKPLAASVLAVGTAFVFYVFSYSIIKSEALHFAITLMIALIVYIPASFAFGNITKNDLSLFLTKKRAVQLCTQKKINKKTDYTNIRRR